jgi:mycofactocin precursor
VAGNDVPSAIDQFAPVQNADAGDEAAGGVIVADAPAAGELIASELLVEEISIDGMCGVY